MKTNNEKWEKEFEKIWGTGELEFDRLVTPKLLKDFIRQTISQEKIALLKDINELYNEKYDSDTSDGILTLEEVLKEMKKNDLR